MTQPREEVIAYKRARFATRLPVARRYTLSHFWLREEEPGVWQIGFAKFAARMLGEMVEYEFSVAAGTPVAASIRSRADFTISSQAPMTSRVTMAAFVSPSSRTSTPGYT
jgi:hypothetical protein